MRAEQEGRDQLESERVLHPQDGGAESAFTDLAGEEVLKDSLSQAGGGAPRWKRRITSLVFVVLKLCVNN